MTAKPTFDAREAAARVNRDWRGLAEEAQQELDAWMSPIYRPFRVADAAKSLLLDHRETRADLLAALDLLKRAGEALEWVRDVLDQRADAEGNGPADYRPNWEMVLLNKIEPVLDELRRAGVLDEPNNPADNPSVPVDVIHG